MLIQSALPFTRFFFFFLTKKIAVLGHFLLGEKRTKRFKNLPSVMIKRDDLAGFSKPRY